MKPELLSILKKSSLFGMLEEAQLNALGKVSTVHKFSKGETIFVEGDLAAGFFLVVSGEVKIVRYGANGKEQILHIFGTNEPVGEAAVFAGEVYPATCITVSTAELCRIKRHDFVSLIMTEPEVAMNLLAILARRLQHFSKLASSLSLDEAPVRLARYIYEQIQVGETINHEISLSVSKGELAKNLGMAPETLSRSFLKLRNEGVIETQGRLIKVIDWELLVAMQE